MLNLIKEFAQQRYILLTKRGETSNISKKFEALTTDFDQ